METFGDALKKARVAKRFTLREVGRYIGKSVSYLSDIEQDRKGPPDVETVRKIEEFLGMTDNPLVILASKLRNKVPQDITQRIQRRPQLAELLTRTDDLSDQDLEELICQATLIPEKRKREA
jgi:transcriptional regulator with XRE-family HTH domain